MADIPFATQSYRHASRPLSSQRLLNFYAEAQPKESKSPVALLGTPGIVTAISLGDGPVRGLHVMNDVLFAVSGGFLYQINADHSVVNLGGQISDTAGPVSMDDNATELVIVNGINGYIWSQIAGFRLISDPDFHPAETVTFMDQFFLFEWKGTGKFFRSDLLDGTSYDSTAFTTAESKSDSLLAVRNQSQILYALGTSSIELYNNTGAANFPFQRIPGATISRGIASPHVVADEDESLFILGEDRIAYRLSGRSLQRISTHAIENEWQNYAKVSDAFVHSYGWNGHKFVCFTFPTIAASWEYDIATSLWHERESRDRLGNELGRWRANCTAQAYGRVYVGDAFSGKLGYLSNTVYTEFGDGTVAEAISPPLHGSGKRVFMPWFELDIETGVGLTSEVVTTFIGRALRFEGGYVTMGDVLDLTTSFTLEARITSDNIDAPGQRILNKDNGSAGGWGLSLGDGGSGKIRFFHRQLNVLITDSPSAIALNQQAHVAVVFDAAADTVTIYIDGVQTAQTIGQTNPITGNAEPLTIGATPTDPALSNSRFSGAIDDVRMWNIARTPAQILANKDVPLTGLEAGLVGYWKFDEASGLVAVDSSPSHADGTLVGTVERVDSVVWGTNHTNPMVMLSISDNGGWSFDPPELWASMGRRGETDGTAYQLRWDRLGNFFERCVKVSVSDPVRRTIYAARGPEMSVGT